MTAPNDLERGLRAMLVDDAPTREPEHLFDAVMSATASTRQRPALLAGGGWGAFDRTYSSSSSIRRLAPLLLLVGLLVTAILAGAVLVGGGSRRSGIVLPVESPSPTVPASASPAVSPGPSAMAILAGESWIAYMSQVGGANTDRVWLVRPDGNDRHQVLTGLDGQQEHPDWSPDGERIAFDHWTDDPAVAGRSLIDIWTMRPDGSEVTRVASCSLPCYQLAYPSWSPDGTRLAIVRFDEQVNGIWGPSAIETVDLATGVRSVVFRSADGSTAFYGPRWSPDGSEIVFTVETYTDATEASLVSARLAIVKTDGTSTEPRVITPATIEAHEPDWNPADGRIVFRTHFDPADPSTRPVATELYTVRSDASGLEPLTQLGLTNQRAIEPSWTPDGSQVVFTLVDGFGGEQIPMIALMDADGGGLHRLGFGEGTAGRLRPTP